MARVGVERLGLVLLIAAVMALSSGLAAVAAEPAMVASGGSTSVGAIAPVTTAPVITGAAAAYDSYEASESALAAHYASIAQGLEASGVPARLIHLPSAEPAGMVDGKVVPGPLYAQELEAAADATDAVSQGYKASPAPSGIAYYGESGADSGSSEKTTVLDTSSLAGHLNVTNWSALYLDTDNPDQWGVQLNAVVTNVTLWGSSGESSKQANGYAFWAQNVIGYQAFNQTLQFDENTWNFTSSAESFPASGTIVAHNINDTLEDSEVYVSETKFFYAPEPFNLTLYMNLSLYNNLICNSYSSLYGTSACSSPAAALAGYAGDQTLFYNYSLSFPATNTKVPVGTHYSGSFDWLTFHTSKTSVEDSGANTRSAGFEASGAKDEEIGLPLDYELDFAIGAFDGANQANLAGSGTASLNYVSDCTAATKTVEASCTIPAHPTYKSVPAALNFGSQTGEDAVGVDVNYVSASKEIADFSAGPLNLHPLWGYTSQTGVTAGQGTVTNDITVSGSPLTLTEQPYIFVFLEDTSVTAPAAAFSWAPDVPTWYVMPGTYDWEAMLADYTEQTGSFTVTAGGSATITATLPYSTTAGVYTPLWAISPFLALSNARLAGISTSGAGTLSSPYVLFDNNDTATSQALNSVFESADDYEFPSFAGLLLANTTAYVDSVHQVEFYSGSTSLEYYQEQLYETQHVTIEKTHNILGYGEQTTLFETTAAQNPIPTAELMIWNSTSDLVMDDTFVSEKAHSSSYVAQDNLLLFGGGSLCSSAYTVGPGPQINDPCGGVSGPAPAGSQNVIWGNTFCDTACTTSPSTPGTYAGIAEAENGDLIYNNDFKVDNPAPLMPWDLETEFGPVYYHDTWNVPEQAASNVVETVNGFALSGNVLDTGSSTTYALQGGNYWWNYGGSLDPSTTAPYYNEVDYTDGATTIFPPPYTSNDENGILGAGDASPLGGFAVTFQETGLPTGTAWYVNLTLPGQAHYPLSSTGTTQTPLYLSDGTYAVSGATANKEYALASLVPPVSVAGAAKTVTLSFTKYTSNVEFNEVGLPAGTQWWVNITGQSSLSSTSPSILGTEANGTYTYTVASTAKNYSVAGGSYTQSGPTTVDITFTLLTAAPSAFPNPVEVGVATELSAGAAGGSGTYAVYAWSGLPSGCANPGNVASFSCTPSASGTFDVQVTVTDSNGAVATGSFELSVSTGLVVSAQASVNPVDEGNATTITAVAGGGVGSYSYVWSGLPSGCGSPGDVASFVCTPAPGDASLSPYTVQVSVTDGIGGTTSNSFQLTVYPALGAGTLSATVNPVDVGETTILSTSGATGGSGSYSYEWFGLPSGCASTAASFACTPTASGTYDVVFLVIDTTNSGASGSFSLTVDPALVAAPSATVNPVDQGEATVLAAGASGGSGLYSYVWGGLPAGCAGSTASFVCTPASSGTFAVWVNVTDSNGGNVNVSFSLVVVGPLSAAPSATVNPVDVGQSTTISAGASGGSGTYTAYVWGGLPTGCAGSGASFTCTPAASGTFTVWVNVTDSNGATANTSFSLVVYPALSAAPSATPNPLDVGQTTTVAANAAGGSGTYGYAWGGLAGSGCAGSGASFACAPTQAGTYTVWVNVTDGTGAYANVSFSLVVDSAVSAGTAGATPNPVTVGTATTIGTSGASGGAGGYTYAWSGLPSSCSAGDVASFSCTPSQVGAYTVELTVTDANGEAATSTFTLTVNPVGTYQVTFTETGLPAGTSWTVHVSGGTTLTGTTTTLSADLVNGAYTYTVSSANTEYAAAGGTFTVASAAVGVTVAFHQEKYSLTYTETGIPAKKLAKVGWTVEVNGTVKTETTATITFTGLTNGSYSLLILGPNGYRSSVASGSQTVAGTTGVTVAFAKGSTAVLSFHEKGLPKKTTWCVAVDGDSVCSTTGVVKFAGLTPGSYGFVIESPTAGYTITTTVGKTPVASPITLTKSTAVTVKFKATGSDGTAAARGSAGLLVEGARTVSAAGAELGAVVAVASALALVGAAWASRRGGAPGAGSEA